MFGCSCGWMSLVWLYLLYKLVDLLIRIPKRSSPSSVINNILITGCDMGFGRILALRLDRMGFRVFAACLTEKGKTDLEKASGTGRINAFLMDVRDTKSIEKAYDHVKKSLSKGVGLWGIVNNAGIMQPRVGPVEWLTREDYQICCDVNIFGMVEVTRIFLPLVKMTKGRIVNTASIVGRMGFPGSAAYVASKYAVEGYSDSLRAELVIFGIKVHIIEPGFHATNLLDIDKLKAGAVENWNRLPAHLKEEYSQDYSYKAQEGIQEMVDKLASTKLDDVVDCYDHALLSYFPRGRYMPGKDARFLWWPLSRCPEWVVDWFFNRDPKKPVPQSCQK